MNLLISFVLGAVLLAVAQWIVLTVSKWSDRHKRRLGRKVRVVVLVDRMRASRRRRCFWRYVFRSPNQDLRQRVRLQLVSIADELERKRNPAIKLFSSEETDLIVVNWDAINGDPAYGSDRSYNFLYHYRPDMLAWLSQGGLLLVESQGASWSLTQDPYSCITSMFGGSSVHVSSDIWTLGDRASPYPNNSKDPLVSGLQDADLQLTPGGLWARKSWFPRKILRGDIQSIRFARRHQQHLYRGCFDAWSSDWRPVIMPRVMGQALDDTLDSSTATERPSQAIAVYRAVHEAKEDGKSASDNGFVVLTTMFIASSELFCLIENVLSLPDRSATS
jgi:hypothetical protein